MPDESADKPKIIIDEDWKSRVEAEKQAAPKQVAAAKPDAGAAAPEKAAGPAASAPIPSASLAFLITTLASQAMMSLGQLPNPTGGKTAIHLPEARHFIDMLTVLEEKTAGNRTPEESAILDGFLHELRLVFVEVQSAQAGKGG